MKCHSSWLNVKAKYCYPSLSELVRMPYNNVLSPSYCQYQDGILKLITRNYTWAPCRRGVAVLPTQAHWLFDCLNLRPFMARQMMSLRCEWRCCLGGRFSGRLAPTTFPQLHVCGSYTLQPSLWATDILGCLSDSRRPTDVIGGAASQFPECGDAAARSIALSMSVEAWDQTSC